MPLLGLAFSKVARTIRQSPRPDGLSGAMAPQGYLTELSSPPHKRGHPPNTTTA